ncbi:uncharacterized protein DEA37_0013235 [Paragonimus westermani]|uniref:Endonuclease/exonuclease/phosphatase domain-containing protein n=1 Tax=Paragonimus westermani TaxID=34504 RepID=A0A5J4NKR2_9TREM|nr:uncharacterized protein DEA37_0013235 [Paragonimus westermani]
MEESADGAADWHKCDCSCLPFPSATGEQSGDSDRLPTSVELPATTTVPPSIREARDAVQLDTHEEVQWAMPVWMSWQYLSPHTTMNPHSINSSILRRPSRSINRVALSAAYSRVDRRKHAAADPSLTVLSNLALRPLPTPDTDKFSAGPTTDIIIHSNTVPISPNSRHSVPDLHRPVLPPRTEINIDDFNVRTLKQTGQRAALTRTLDSLHMDVCRISETSSQRMQLTASALSTRYWLYISGDSPVAITGQAGVGVVLSTTAAAALIDWISVNSRHCAVRLAGSVRVSPRRKTVRNLFVVSAYAPTDCSDIGVKDVFYSDLAALLRSTRGSDIVVLAGDMNAQVGRFGEAESRLGGRFGIASHCSDNGGRLLQLCAEHRVFLASTSFRHHVRRYYTWRPPSLSQTRSQIGHIAVSYRWRGSIQDCRSYLART